MGEGIATPVFSSGESMNRIGEEAGSHTFRAVIGMSLIGALWNQSTTPLRYLVMSLVKGTEGGNSSRPLILLVGQWGLDPSWGTTILVQSPV